MDRLFSIFKDENGATAVEYALILGMVFLAAVGAIGGVAAATSDMWNTVSVAVTTS